MLVLHTAFATTYGIFRDELYYLACAARLDWGYVDHPPLVAGVTALWTGVFGDSLLDDPSPRGARRRGHGSGGGIDRPAHGWRQLRSRLHRARGRAVADRAWH